jgi:polyisoprenoid-binding protein YceI
MKLFILTFLMAASASATPYTIDPSHTDVGFSVKHLMISNVKGRFKKFSGTFDFDPAKNQLSNIVVEIDTTTIDTNEPDRDKHLRSNDFFGVDKYPKMTFKSDKIEYSGDKPVKAIGTLKIRDKSKTVALDLDYRGSIIDPWGNNKLAFAATTKIDRKDFGMVWNKALDKGGVTVGDEVTISIEGEATPTVAKK